MTKSMPRMAVVFILYGVLLGLGCAGGQYASPAAQEESRTYRSLYQPFGLEAGPSATTGGSE